MFRILVSTPTSHHPEQSKIKILIHKKGHLNQESFCRWFQIFPSYLSKFKFSDHFISNKKLPGICHDLHAQKKKKTKEQT